ncbi:type I polyketide synthase [Microbulbifer sp. GL-2]|uniref:type I polyketide synthase n=1 Tax=Microbulbifer sp. GL-2 TaxID=2591606 RepID=UPI001163ABD6|nr:type I polyketide synthase [Microbulbifer sp. GL-2]BBM00785.1 hypothetical protein GL2_08590 [Microbulbifer sp. GL-2]
MTEKNIMGGEDITEYENDIAIIGMSGRFPDAADVEKYWENLSNGVESVRFFDHDQLKAMGIDEHLLDNPKFVAADAVLDHIDLFDARFFNMSPREAEITDPQHRLFLEAAWELMERSGYSPQKYKGRVGVYAGAALSGYMMRNLKSNPGLIERLGTFKIMLANDKDFLSTKVSYQMGFTGPSVNVNTLCSSSAVAIHLAAESLLNHQCDLAMAGGVSLQITRNEAFFYQEGKIGSPDGHCRAFDERAAGTVSGSGLGIIALRRLEDAITDGDNILAVLKGTAVNNDGSGKASYTAPSVDGQAEVIIEAQELAGIDPDTITYIEAHGTGTHLGDPIEVAGLTKAFSRQTQDHQFCALGSVKTNIGHLVTAGGVASVIKTVLALQNRKIPASLNFERANPKIDFVNSPFYVNTHLSEWSSRNGAPLRAGVSSFGIGGTNVHMILEEAPDQPTGDEGKPWMFFPLSAKTDTSLQKAREKLANFIDKKQGFDLADVAYTLQVGRNDFEFRSAYVSDSSGTLSTLLKQDSTEGSFHGVQKPIKRNVVFMFPGQGAQYASMGQDLYQNEPIFRHYFDQCAALFLSHLDTNITEILFSSYQVEADEKLKHTILTQPALFSVEYALAKLWQHWGVEAEAMIGHSIGEYVAACLSGVFSLEDAVKLVSHRAKLMSEAPSGAMLSVALSAQQLDGYLTPDLWIAAENGVSTSVISGTLEAIDILEARLHKETIQSVRLHTSHAFHSGLMEEASTNFSKIVDSVTLTAPTTPFISNVTGTWITPEEACDSDYWARQLRAPVMFVKGMDTIAEVSERILLEVGPSNVLCQLSRQSASRSLRAIPSMPSAKQRDAGYRYLMEAMAQLWLVGVEPDWDKYYENIHRMRVELPTYQFDHQSYWIEEKRQSAYNTQANQVVKNSAELKEVIDSGKLIESGLIPVEIDCSELSSDPFEKRQQFDEVLKLSKEINQLIEKSSANSSLSIRVAPLNLELVTDDQMAEDVLQYADRGEVSTAFVGAETETQKLLELHWREILGIREIGINDNFFDIGGNSLLAAALAVKLRAKFQVEIPLAELLERPTIAQLADLLDTKLWLMHSDQTDIEDSACEEGSL